MTVNLPHPASASTYLLSQKATTVKSFLRLPAEKIQAQAGTREAAFSMCCLHLAFLTEQASVTLYSDWLLSHCLGPPRHYSD